MSELETDATTELLPRARAAEPEAAPAPVFVDATGRRRRVAHRLTLGLFLAAVCYSLMVIWSLLGGPVSPDSLMPFSAPHPTHSGTKPTVSAHPSTAAAGNPTTPFASAHATTPMAGAGTSAGASAPSATASASASASATGHRPTAAPGKPTSSPTNGHGH
jgi:hypothetical protein